MNASNYTTPFWVQDNSGQSWTLSITPTNTPDWTFTVQYSINGGTWSNFGTTSSSSAITKNFTASQKVYLRATTNHWGFADLVNDTTRYYTIKSNKNFSIGGNIMSLIYGSTFVENGVVKKTYPDDTIPGIFNRTFNSVTTLIDASELVFPVTHSNTIGNLNRCYQATFRDCTNLVNGPHIDLRARESSSAPYDLPYCFQSMFQNCSKLESVYFNTQNGNYRYNSTFNGITADILTIYNYSGTIINQQGPTQENRATLYQGFDRVTGWESSVNGDLNQVNGTNNILLWKKYNEGGAMDPSVLEDIYENADKTFPSAPATGFNQMVKNINASPMTITFTCRNQPSLESHAGSSVTFEYYIADGAKQTIVFDADHKKYTDTIPAGECCFYNNYSLSGITNAQIPGTNINRSWIRAKCSDFYIVKMSTTPLTVSFEGDSNLIAANASTFSGDRTIVNGTWDSMDNGWLRYSFASCTNLLYPPNITYTSGNQTGCYAYFFYHMFDNCTNLKRPMANIRIPRHWNASMCAEMYKGCENLTNVDNAFLFGNGAASTFVNRYASTDVPNTETDRYPFVFTFANTFAGCIRLTSAKFHLPCVRNMHTAYQGYTMDTQSCFVGMFSGCRRLVEPPKIECMTTSSSSTAYATLPFACYQQMFYQCYNLQKMISAMTGNNISGGVTSNAWSYNTSTGYFENTGVSAGIDFITIGANPYYGVEPDAIEDNQTGNYYKGNTPNSYMPDIFNGWTLLLRTNWWE